MRPAVPMAGVAGYTAKDLAIDELERAIGAVARGEACLSSEGTGPVCSRLVGLHEVGDGELRRCSVGAAGGREEPALGVAGVLADLGPNPGLAEQLAPYADHTPHGERLSAAS